MNLNQLILQDLNNFVSIILPDMKESIEDLEMNFNYELSHPYNYSTLSELDYLYIENRYLNIITIDETKFRKQLGTVEDLKKDLILFNNAAPELLNAAQRICNLVKTLPVQNSNVEMYPYLISQFPVSSAKLLNKKAAISKYTRVPSFSNSTSTMIRETQRNKVMLNLFNFFQDRNIGMYR